MSVFCKSTKESYPRTDLNIFHGGQNHYFSLIFLKLSIKIAHKPRRNFFDPPPCFFILGGRGIVSRLGQLLSLRLSRSKYRGSTARGGSKQKIPNTKIYPKLYQANFLFWNNVILCKEIYFNFLWFSLFYFKKTNLQKAD